DSPLFATSWQGDWQRDEDATPGQIGPGSLRGRPRLQQLRRLDRPLTDPLARPGHADRGDPARARRPRPPGQGALPRLLNFAGWQVVEAQGTACHLGLAAFVSCQNECSLLVRDAKCELVPAMQAYGLGPLPYFLSACERSVER